MSEKILFSKHNLHIQVVLQTIGASSEVKSYVAQTPETGPHGIYDNEPASA